MNGKLSFRLSKSGQRLNKDNSFQVKVNGVLIGQIDSVNPTFSKPFPIGSHSIEVSEKDFVFKQDILLAAGQLQTITINPSLTYKLARGFSRGFAISAFVLIGYMGFKSDILPQILPIMLIPIFALIVFSKKDFKESFALTVRKSRM